MGNRKSSPKFISARVWAGDGQPQEFAEIHFGMGLGRRWETEMNFGQPAGRRGLGRRWATEMNFAQPAGRRGLDRRWATEMNFAQPAGRRGLGRRWAGARVRRNSFRHGAGQAMGSRKRSPTFIKSSPKFISARGWTGDGQAQAFAEIHFGMGLGRRWATEMNFAQPAGRRGLDRRWAGARVRRNSFRHGSGQAMGRRKSSPKFISARVWAGDGRPK